MKNAISINYADRTIDLSASFAKAASIFGSAEYKTLTEAKRDFPTYTVNVVSSKRKNPSRFKNLTLEFIESYIRKHDDDNHSNLTEFAKLRGLRLDGDKLTEYNDGEVRNAVPFLRIRSWFLETYRDKLESYDKEVDEILKKAREARAARKVS